jgi:hypothetical protein
LSALPECCVKTMVHWWIDYFPKLIERLLIVPERYRIPGSNQARNPAIRHS